MYADEETRTLVIPIEGISCKELNEYFFRNPTHRGFSIRGETEEERTERRHKEYFGDPTWKKEARSIDS